MDDYDINSLIESKNEWCSRLVNIFTPPLIDGLKSIFNEAQALCVENDEESKYLMTFQNLLINIPKWSPAIIEKERERIITSSNCNYIEDLISCVHIIQLKALTATRVGIKQKKIDIEIPSVDNFIHKVYINIARKVYLSMYLFEIDIAPLQIQKNNRELELIIKEIILNTIRDNIPVEELLKAYLDETEETDVVVEEKRETVLDKDRLEQELAQHKETIEVNKSENVDKLGKVDESGEIGKEALDSDISASLAKINNELQNTENKIDHNVSVEKVLANLEKNNEFSHSENPMSATAINNTENNEKGENNENNENDENNTIKIDTEELNDNLEIMDLNSLAVEPDINLDVEEL